MRNERERFGLVEREREKEREKIVFSKIGQMFVCLFVEGSKKANLMVDSSFSVLISRRRIRDS